MLLLMLAFNIQFYHGNDYGMINIIYYGNRMHVYI